MPFLLVVAFGVIATVSFTQFFALLFRNPNVGLGIFLPVVNYASLFLFYQQFYLGLLLPNTFFCFALTKHITTSLEHDTIDPYVGFEISTAEQILVLVVQTGFYFFFSVLVDKVRRSGLKTALSFSGKFADLCDYPIEVDLRHSERQTEYSFKVEEGKVTALYGASESGKTELIRLLSTGGSRASAFEGKCVVLGIDILGGHPVPFPHVEVCQDEDYLEQSFTLFQHLCFTA